MEKKDLALGKINFIMLAVSMALVVIGFVMMSGATSDVNQYNPEIFSAMRIKVAPVICFIGFVSIIVGIMYRPKCKGEEQSLAEVEKETDIKKG